MAIFATTQLFRRYTASVITLTLLHPIQSIPVQSWTFQHEPVIRIGRSTDNHVILYSAVVSRHHVELRQIDSQWEVVSLGANGTYVDGKRITQVPVVDGIVIRLARSGPNIRIHVGSSAVASDQDSQGDKTLSQRAQPTVSQASAVGQEQAMPQNSSESLPIIEIPVTRQLDDDSSPATPSGELTQRRTNLDEEDELSVAPVAAVPCSHSRAQGTVLFCPDCGKPLHVEQTLGEYQVMKTLGQEALSVTQLGWRNGQSFLLQTLAPEGLKRSDVLEAFTQQAKQLLRLEHPGLPPFVDFFVLEEKPYLVQAQVYGQNLQQRVSAQGPLSQPEAIAMMVQICTILGYLHQQSPPLLHQDLKPANLLQQSFTTAAGTPTIVGFGTLKSFVAASETATAAPYTAPEQWQGQATVATDLFALGPILVYLLTGQAPETFYAQREQGFRFYPEYVPGLETELAAIVRRLTSPKPEERYATAKEVAEALLEVSGQQV